MRESEGNVKLSPSRDPDQAVCEEDLAVVARAAASGECLAREAVRAQLPRARMARLISGPVPLALVAFQGLVTIALTGTAGRGYIHRLLLTVVLAENIGALSLRNRHPCSR